MSVSLTHVSPRWIAEFVCAGSSPTRGPIHSPILCWSIWRQLHRCTCTAPVTLLAENKKEGREGGTPGGVAVVSREKVSEAFEQV